MREHRGFGEAGGGMSLEPGLAAPVLGGLGEFVTAEAGCRCNFAGGKPRGVLPWERRDGSVPAGCGCGDSECGQGSEALASSGIVWILQGTELGLGELQPAWGLCSADQFLISLCSPFKCFPVHPPWAKHACFALLALLQVNKKIRKWKCSLWGW